ncbi:SLOB protein kinase, variant 2 [Aphanomyces invadans]|uniref:SLOB protein kinase, variant 2 n=1 Tax=Aphanomyces invadans TaxID=157072 RepID=A0A024UCX4_9STRA|nr:SLOB protein kinase, variant 2 [Aphanomyces invadans]ETW04060.1 SLOB protein kinase, variant 2 [Aphanomyces invadans]|eukprot:XP_008867016.1 SLOB protein kinase, variant 2 [Aphanomyces invadans]
MGTGNSRNAVPSALRAERCFPVASVVADTEYSMSHAVLYAYKFTQRHPLFQWNDVENVAHGMGSSSSSKLHVLVDIADMSGEVGGRALLSVMQVSSSLLLSTTFSSQPSTYKLKALLVSLRHTCILPILDVDKHHGGHNILIVAQPFIPTGSIKDLIYCNPAPTKEYSTKYNRPGRRVPRTLISRYGRHVLEALSALRSIGVVCDNLATSTVMLDQDIARVSNVYGSILGLDRDVHMQELTLPLEATVPLDLLLFGYCDRIGCFLSRLISSPLHKPPPLSGALSVDRRCGCRCTQERMHPLVDASVACRSHFLYEMATGRELSAVVPAESDLVGAIPLDVADVRTTLCVDTHCS